MNDILYITTSLLLLPLTLQNSQVASYLTLMSSPTFIIMMCISTVREEWQKDFNFFLLTGICHSLKLLLNKRVGEFPFKHINFINSWKITCRQYYTKLYAFLQIYRNYMYVYIIYIHYVMVIIYRSCCSLLFTISVFQSGNFAVCISLCRRKIQVYT